MTWMCCSFNERRSDAPPLADRRPTMQGKVAKPSADSHFERSYALGHQGCFQQAFGELSAGPPTASRSLIRSRGWPHWVGSPRIASLAANRASSKYLIPPMNVGFGLASRHFRTETVAGLSDCLEPVRVSTSGGGQRRPSLHCCRHFDPKDFESLKDLKACEGDKKCRLT